MSFVFVIAVYVLPLAGHLHMFISVPLLLALAGSLLLMLSQPGFPKKEVVDVSNSDRGSVFVILLAGLIVHIMPVLEWQWRGFPGATGGSSIVQFAGVICASLGLALRIYSIRLLGRFFTPTVQIQQEHDLVTAGPYGAIRHPSYLGALIAMIGHALVLGAPISAGLCSVIMLVVYRYRIMIEEATLRTAFGERYANYETRTHRLIPRIW